jgi:serine protease Do
MAWMIERFAPANLQSKLMRLPGSVEKLILGAVAAGLAAASPLLLGKESTDSLDWARQLNQAFVRIADEVSPSVVVVDVAHRPDHLVPGEEDGSIWESDPRGFRRPPEQRRERPRREAPPRPLPQEPFYDSQGSGVVIREDGYILTNRHVVDGAEKIKVRFSDGREYEASVRGVDSRSDLAVLKVNARGLRAARLGDSAQTRVGEFAIAIGAPFELDYSLTVGHVSAKGRSHIIDDPAADQDFLQTDANINPGNSGGPLVNLYGEVIGINTLIRSLHSGIGFAIPINLAREVADQLIAEGRFTRSWLGIGIRALRDAPEYRELSPEITDGLVVTEIKQDGPARNSDLKPADVIVALDDKPITAAQQLKNEIRAKAVGQTISLDVQRNGERIKVRVKTDAWQDEPLPVVNKSRAEPEDNSPPFGLTVQPLTEAAARQSGVEKLGGVLVTGVERDSAAERAGLRPGHVITEVNRKPVASLKQFREAIASANRKKGVLVIFATHEAVKCEILRDGGD